MKALLVLPTLCIALLPAQDAVSRSTVVRASGEAAVSVRPDETTLHVAVVTTAGTAERASAKNAERATSVIARLRELLGQDANIKTANYTLNKSYADGYVAKNMIEIHVNDPIITGKVIDVATKSGASIIDRMESSAVDEQNARSEALKQATARARTNAEAIAAALSMRVVRVASAETSPFPIAAAPLNSISPEVSFSRRAIVPTPVALGVIEVRVQVTVTLEVAP
jgi:uncharacterized protein YggE